MKNKEKYLIAFMLTAITKGTSYNVIGVAHAALKHTTINLPTEDEVYEIATRENQKPFSSNSPNARS